MMPNLKSFSQLADSNPITPWEAFYRQQRLMLLWLDADRARRLFAEVQELAQRVAERLK
jgi:hypothetical protein